MKNLKDLYESHSEFEIVQLMVKLFNLDLKDDNSLALAFEIRSIRHNVDVTGTKMGIRLTTFFKAFYLTYSHYLESPHSSEQLKSINFDTLVEKFT